MIIIPINLDVFCPRVEIYVRLCACRDCQYNEGVNDMLSINCNYNSYIYGNAGEDISDI